jgi:hypothetical protein
LKEPELVKGVKDEIENWRKNEEVNKTAANLSFALRQAEDDFDFLGMDALAVTAEGEGAKGKQQSLWKDAVSYKPVRNAVGHTGVLTNTAKSHLSVTFENIKARIKAFMKDVTK